MNNDQYFEDEEFRELLNEYEQAAESGQPIFMDADDLGDIADYYQQQGRFDEAGQVLDRILEIAPDSLVALNYLVHNAINNEDYEEAEHYLSQIKDHDEPEYIYCRAELWIAQDDIEQADDYLRKCFMDVPPDEYQEFVLDAANLYTDYGYNEKALEWMMRAKQDNTDDFKELMGRTLFGLGKYDDSERIFNELIDRNPFQKRYWNELASTQFMKEDYGASVTSSEYAIAIDPNDPDGILSKANALYKLGNYEDALMYFKRYTEREPDDEFSLFSQGSCLYNMGRFEEALEPLKRAEAMALDGSNYLVEIYQELAFVYSEMKMPETAVYYIDKTDELDCDHADMHVIRGHILLANNRFKDAKDHFKTALRHTKTPLRTLMRVIVSIYDNRYLSSSYTMFTNFFNMVDDKWTEGYSYMALCCYDLKRYDEFLDYLKKACQLNPQEARLVLAHLFPVDMKAGEYYEYMRLKLKD